jgi:CelD/BcsL family acetyltransferase involved in cellulose biosynthesis
VTSVLYVEVNPISIILNLGRGHIHSQWIAGYDPEYSHFSPGQIVRLRCSLRRSSTAAIVRQVRKKDKA